MTNPTEVEKTSDLKKLNIHSNFILNKFNTRFQFCCCYMRLEWEGMYVLECQELGPLLTLNLYWLTSGILPLHFSSASGEKA